MLPAGSVPLGSEEEWHGAQADGISQPRGRQGRGRTPRDSLVARAVVQCPSVFPRPLEGQSYQNSGGDHALNRTVDQSFWETFGSAESTKGHRSPSSDSWTCADASAEKRSSDSWDVWGSGSASTNKNSDHSDLGEAWAGSGEGRAKTAKKATPPVLPVDEGWDTQDW